MLSTVKKCIHSYQLDNTTFEELFTQYVIAIQDINIMLELNYMNNYNKLDSNSLNYVLNLSIDELRRFRFDK